MKKEIVTAAALPVLAVLLGCAADPCEEFCQGWRDLTDGQTECAAALLEMQGYPVLDVPACVGVETPEQCRRCREVLEVAPEICREVHETCIVGRGLSPRAADRER